jgi:hypothetical protein
VRIGAMTGEVFYAVRSVVKRNLTYVKNPKACVAVEGLSVQIFTWTEWLYDCGGGRGRGEGHRGESGIATGNYGWVDL